MPAEYNILYTLALPAEAEGSFQGGKIVVAAFSDDDVIWLIPCNGGVRLGALKGMIVKYKSAEGPDFLGVTHIDLDESVFVPLEATLREVVEAAASVTPDAGERYVLGDEGVVRHGGGGWTLGEVLSWDV